MAENNLNDEMQTESTLVSDLRVTFTVNLEIKGSLNRRASDATREALANAAELSEEQILENCERQSIETDYNWEPLSSVLLNIESYKHDPGTSWGRRTKRAFDYVVEHFQQEAVEVLRQLHREVAVFDLYSAGADVGSKAREYFIRTTLANIEGRLKQRLPKNSGRPREKDKYHYPVTRRELFFTCINALAKMESEGKKVTFENLAGELYPGNSPDQTVGEPGKALANKLKTFNITWKWLKDYHTGKNRSLIPFHDDEMVVLERMMK